MAYIKYCFRWSCSLRFLSTLCYNLKINLLVKEPRQQAYEFVLHAILFWDHKNIWFRFYIPIKLSCLHKVLIFFSFFTLHGNMCIHAILHIELRISEFSGNILCISAQSIIIKHMQQYVFKNWHTRWVFCNLHTI